MPNDDAWSPTLVGSENVAVGWGALSRVQSTGSENTALGASALARINPAYQGRLFGVSEPPKAVPEGQVIEDHKRRWGKFA